MGKSTATQPHERRNSPRARGLGVEVVLRSPVFIETVELIDVGRLGFSVRTAISHAPGTKLVLEFPGAEPVHATAVWWAGYRMGGRFDQPLDSLLLFSLSAKD